MQCASIYDLNVLIKGTELQIQEMSLRLQPVASMAARPACWAQAGRSLRELPDCGAASVRGRRRGVRRARWRVEREVCMFGEVGVGVWVR